MNGPVAIPHPEDDDLVAGMAGWRFLERAADAASGEWIDAMETMIPKAMRAFPALQSETVNVGQVPDSDFAYARAFVNNNVILFPTDHRPSWDVVYHELAHLAIHRRAECGEDVPKTSEEFCSIFAVSRMPPARIERSNIDYLGKPSVTQEKWPGICERALEYREEHRDYIKQCQQWLGVTDS